MAVHVRIEPGSLNPADLRNLIDVSNCGSVVSFVGLTRGFEEGSKVKRLEFDAWEETLPVVLEELANYAISKFSVHSVLIAHRVGSVSPSEPIVCIHVASMHREEGFSACSWLISELKNQAPLWKKEVREDGAFWKGGLG